MKFKRMGKRKIFITDFIFTKTFERDNTAVAKRTSEQLLKPTNTF